MAKPYSANPREANIVKDDDWMGIESVPQEAPQISDLANMKRIKVGTLLKSERIRLSDLEDNDKIQDGRITDNESAIQENTQTIRDIAIKNTVMGVEDFDTRKVTIELNDSVNYPILGGNFYGYTEGGYGTPTKEDLMSVATLSKIVNTNYGNGTTITLPEPIVLRNGDELVLENSIAKTKIRKNVITLTGNENWESGIQSGGNGRIIRYKLKIADATLEKGRNEIRSNRFTWDGSISSDVGVGFVTEGYLYLYPETNLATVDDFKAWLRTHNTQVEYILQEVRIEPVSSANQVQLSKLQTFDGYTYFETDGILMSIQYMADTKTYIDEAVRIINEKDDNQDAEILRLSKETNDIKQQYQKKLPLHLNSEGYICYGEV